MDQFGGGMGGGGGWTMIPNMTAHANSPAHSNQDQYFLHQQPTPPPPQQQQFNQFQQQSQQQLVQQPFNQQQFQQQSPQQLVQQPPPPQQQFQPLQSPPQQQQFQPLQSPPQRLVQQQTPPQPPPQQSLASHFRLSPLVEKLADAVENGTRDQHSDALVNELNIHFEKCQQLLNSISSSISSKSMTVEGQKKKLEETEQLLNQRSDLIGNYKNSVEDLINSDP
ncbi:unnamed protein product [Linum tenue]|uniref:Mediator of RNA polymerase II transcription subunit 9 n=1 Tax=Linum tenue TaxID=586396 RepID=A0AAV0KB10_9ROSI|nr:unnamed protein product [Linum tenue]